MKNNKIIQASVSALKFNNIIDIVGDLISFENLTESIKNYSVQTPIYIDDDNNVISGNRRALISKNLEIKTIPAFVVDSNKTPLEIEKLRIEFLLTNRNMSHLDIIQIYYYQHAVFEKYDEPYTEYMSKIQNCTQRAIQLKLKAGKIYSTLSDEVKSIFQKLDSAKKIPFTTFIVMSKLEEIDLANFIKEVIETENIEHKHLVSITKQYEEMLARQNRNKTINEDSKKSKESKETKEETVLSEISVNELNSSEDAEIKDDDEPNILVDMKRVFKYEIKKYFNVAIETDEEEDVEKIQSKLHIDFKEELELIKSLLEGAN
ncbi:MAG: hypothetical protein A2019_04405 [Sulfurimonas sp. GWF2_37_8]|nr:MAG: hypothetical protein A2019_04405 [Sulfurimonas sp. GWF2_37_8]